MTFWRLPTRATVAISSLSILTGCSQPAEVINHERITSALHIQVTPTHATQTKLEFDYVISNNTGEDVWAVALPEAAVVTDPNTTNGVIFAQIFFPVDRDLEFTPHLRPWFNWSARTRASTPASPRNYPSSHTKIIRTNRGPCRPKSSQPASASPTSATPSCLRAQSPQPISNPATQWR